LAYPLMTLILLTGGHFGIGRGTYAAVACILLLAAAALPVAALGVEEAVSHNRAGLGLAVAALAAWLLSFMVNVPPLAIAGLSLAAGVLSLVAALRAGGRSFVLAWAVLSAGILAAMLTLDIDFGLVPVETPQWGGLTVTLIVAITGMVASLPIGILLALGRRSQMPIVRIFSVIFIELWRGVPLITVLFMSSVMLPLFLPEGTNFDKLLRALIGVALFTSAYMAEAIRGGLQAIPKGQYEGAMALGLSYWQMTAKIILPQALKISIPNIVSNFIALFKDTTLVSIVGIFDLLGIVRAGLKETIWASPSSTPTAYFALALMFWIFCFGMSRYSMFTERRLHTGHKR
jgi:general L-amino acid transport system permease protein